MKVPLKFDLMCFFAHPNHSGEMLHTTVKSTGYLEAARAVEAFWKHFGYDIQVLAVINPEIHASTLDAIKEV